MMFPLILFTILSYLAQAQRIVYTEYGQVRGHVINVNNGIEQTTIDVFYGIPFAKNPSGSLRFASPVPPDPWTGIFEADTMLEMCPQTGGLIRVTHPDWDTFGENCLHLNIYTPGEAIGPYPVLFWIHGGGYASGGNIQFPGHFLASRGVVVVIPNYRLGKLGFAYTGNDACPGNAGLWDQNMALKFVVNNIVNFSGDPDKITVMGESAGGLSTSLHLVSPQSNTLFHHAVIQSGSESNSRVSPPENDPENITRQIAESVECPVGDDYVMIDCMRQLPWEDIIYNGSFRSSCQPGYECSMGPVVDGPGGFLPQMPEDLRSSGSVMNGPIISGFNKADGGLFLPLTAPGTLAEDCCNRTYFSFVLRNRVVGTDDPRYSNTTEEEVYHAFDYNYTPWPYLHDTEANRQMLVHVQTDWQFAIHTDKQLKDHRTVAPTYGYIYDYHSVNSSLPDWMGTVHGAEIDYIWGFPFFDTNEEVRNDSLFTSLRSVYNDYDVEYTIFMQTLWTNFVKYGNPTPTPVPNPVGGSTVWPQFTSESLDMLYIGADSVHTETDYRQRDFAFWSDYLIFIAGDEQGISNHVTSEITGDVIEAAFDSEYWQIISDERWDEDLWDV